MTIGKRYTAYLKFFIASAVFFTILWRFSLSQGISSTIINVEIFAIWLSLLSALLMIHVLNRYKRINGPMKKEFDMIEKIGQKNKLVKMKEIHFYLIILLVSTILTKYTYPRFTISQSVAIIFFVTIALFLAQYGMSMFASLEYYFKHKDRFH